MKTKYNYVMRYTLLAILAILFFVGIAQDVSIFWTTLVRIPIALAKMIPWLVVTFVVTWVYVDLAARQLFGYSLREEIESGAERFRQMVIVCLIISVPIAMLVATR